MAERTTLSGVSPRLASYRTAVHALLDVSDRNATLLALKLCQGDVILPSIPLRLHPAGVSAEKIAGYRKDLGNRQKAVEAQYKLDEARRINEWRRRAFEQWLKQVAASLPRGWFDYMLSRLRLEVTYVHFMAEVNTLLVETD